MRRTLRRCGEGAATVGPLSATRRSIVSPTQGPHPSRAAAMRKSFRTSSYLSPATTFAIMRPSAPVFRRQLLRELRARPVREPYRCFSCAARLAQQQSQSPPGAQHEKTTHFGFETIAESLKEAKGMQLSAAYTLNILLMFPHKSAASSPPSRARTTR